MHWLRRLFKRNFKSKTNEMSASARRAILSTDSLFDNESLTADLDDPGASVLFQWGAELSHEIASQTAEWNNELAEITISNRMEAARRFMRLVNNWAAQHLDIDFAEQVSMVYQIDEQLSIIRGTTDERCELADVEKFLLENQKIQDSAVLIEHLHLFFNKPFKRKS